MGKVFFVSGIDTGTGKTIATGMMARSLHLKGRRVATVKMVQTGCHGFSEDLDEHRRLMGVRSLPEDDAGLTFPQTFDFPASPHLAAALEHRTVDVAKIVECVGTVSKNYEYTLVEGAGGLAVPLTERLLTIDFAAEQGWPVILVCSGKLGSLNHAILSLEAIKGRGMALAGVIYNYCADADETIDHDSERMLAKFMAGFGFDASIVRLGFVDGTHPEKAAMPDFGVLFGVTC